MKNILFSVDFSKNTAAFAVVTAEVAKLCKARLILFYAYHHPIAGSEGTAVYSERQVQARLDKLARKLHQETGVSITRLVKPASTSHDALDIAYTVKADIAVLCSPETGEASVALNYKEIPVLTVPTSPHTDTQEFKLILADKLQLSGFSPSPLLETV